MPSRYAVKAFREQIPEPRSAKFWINVGAFASWFYRKTQENARQVGTYQAARNLRKQGVPLEHALAILVGRVT